MSFDFDTIFQAAVELPPAQQQELIRRLSLQIDATLERDEATWGMIDARRAEFQAGKTSTLTWEEVKVRLHARK